jgi:transcriptional regulator with XRE-family HTH domain
MTTAAHPSAGDLIRHWRERRRLSQLELAGEADISTRHLSFVETGRAHPSRQMLLRLAEQLDLPLRERNVLLLSAGYAPAYGESPLSAQTPPMAAVREALGQVLRGHEPYPAILVDRHWNLVDANTAASLVLEPVAAELKQPPLNVLRASLHPRGLAPHIINLAEWRAHLLARLRRQIGLTADPQLERLHAELQSYPYAGAPAAPSTGAELVVPLRLRLRGRTLALFSMVASFGTPADITLDELAIETFFPADPITAHSFATDGTGGTTP